MVFAVPSAQAAPPAQPSATVKLLKPVLPKVPTAPAVLAMLRSTLIAVDQGNKTGNYTVVRDLGTPGFREANTPAKLGLVFAPLWTRASTCCQSSWLSHSTAKRPG